MSNMSSSNSYYSYLLPLDLYYLACNICQIMTFSRKTMRNVSTGILFLALSISDTIYLLLCLYNLIIYGFQIPDQSDYGKTC